MARQTSSLGKDCYVGFSPVRKRRIKVITRGAGGHSFIENPIYEFVLVEVKT